MFDYIVIGKGLIGSAAARYLSENSNNVALIGPNEPEDWTTHEGVFASHYDQGRITRKLDDDWAWGLLAKRSIEQYASIEQKSGIKFHHPVGGLTVESAAISGDSYVEQSIRVGTQLGAEFTTLDDATIPAVAPMFTFSEPMRGVLEASPAGYINPRQLVQAQVIVAQQQGAVVINETVKSIRHEKNDVSVSTIEDKTYQAQKVLLAAGAFTNLLWAQPLDFTAKARTILLAELPDTEIERLQTMPTLIYDSPAGSNYADTYLLPPIRYPDGKTYLKLGGGPAPQTPSMFPEFRDWFQGGGNPTDAEELQAILLSIMPNLQATSFQMKPCVTTTTVHGYPFIDALEPGQLYVAAAGCGYAAKSSNELGRLAAQLVEQEVWGDTELSEGRFKARFMG